MTLSSTVAAEPSSGQKSATVLIADDEPAIAKTLSLVFEAHGYHAVVARSGEEAVEQARASTPDVLVSDIIMPGISGIEAALKIRTLCPDCRVILISGNIMSTELLERAQADGNTFEVLAKPFHPSRLLGLLRGGIPAADSSS